ncbi:MAG: hypothetical protein OQJ95_08215 [Kangiella sp.]|nr:hypothetical protein [Kangiella sp.]
MNKKGRLVCVGTGIKLMVHMTPVSKQQIERADIVFLAVASSLMGSWIKELNSNIHDLGQYYQEGKSRLDTYKEIIRSHPGQKAIIVSGYSSTDRVKEAQSLGAGTYVKKPYVLETLGQAVKQELDGNK